ncbi:MAG: hypothetical protein LC746_18185 [Acidobacteria bacterium]|nr:hypothetical protein [Acidobacteriota bacterium]
MSEKRSKYDTDPLDPDFARQTEEVWGGATRGVADAPTEMLGGDAGTRPMQPGEDARLNPNSEAATRRIDDQFAQGYPSVFAPPPAPNYQPPTAPHFNPYAPPPQAYAPPPQSPYAPPPHAQGYVPPTPNRHVAGVGIAEKWVTALPYAPFYIGVVVSIIELLVVPRGEPRARFHAAQGLALQLGFIVISYALRLVGLLSGSRAGAVLFGIAAFVFLVYSFFRVLGGSDYRIAPLSDATRWLDEKIDPKKK